MCGSISLMKKKQCWEVMECCKHLEDEHICGIGVCPAKLPSEYDGINGGKNGGRFCWAIMGTFGQGNPRCTYSSKIVDCLSCELYIQVEIEEGSEYVSTPHHANV